jgi:hypothetical protein
LRKPIELTALVWPVFRIGVNPPNTSDGLLYIANESIDQESNMRINAYVIDDKNIDRPTLGLRRLTIDKKDLYPLHTAIYTLQDLVKLSSPKTWFIDNSGQVFQYKKSTRAKLQTYKINQVLPVSGIGCVLEIQGFSERFKSLTVPSNTEKYAGILTYNGKNILYGLYTTNIEPTWRLV